MGTYVKEFSPLKGCKGQKVLSLLIEHSLRAKSVYFEVYASNNAWHLYWNYEILPEEFSPIIRKYAKSGATFMEVLADNIILERIAELSTTYSCQLNGNEIEIVQRLAKNGLPDLNRQKPQGFDGHSYKVELINLQKQYRCWCVIPREWKVLIPLIELFCSKANLNKHYLICGIR